METATEQAPQWAIVELMGHVRTGGLISKDTQLCTPLLRLDVPQKNGSFVTQLVNHQSLYRVTFCEEALARAAADQGDAKPLNQWEVKHLALPASASQPERAYFHPEDGNVYFMRGDTLMAAPVGANGIAIWREAAEAYVNAEFPHEEHARITEILNPVF